MDKVELWIDSYIQTCRNIRTLSERTLQAYYRDIRNWYHFLAQEDISLTVPDRNAARLYIGSLTMRQLSPSTINRTLSSLKGYYDYLEKKGHSRGNPFTGVRSQKKPSSLPVYLTNREIETLIDSTGEGSFESTRDRALFELLYSTGCRVSELCHLDRKSVDQNRILISGKGGRQRYVFIGKSARQALEAYIPLRDKKLHTLAKDGITALILDYKGERLTTRGV